VLLYVYFSLFLTVQGRQDEPTIIRVDEDEFNLHNRIKLVSEGGKELVSSGLSSDKIQKVVIVDPNTLTQLEPYQIGEIWIPNNKHTPLGYFRNESLTDDIFRAKHSGSETVHLRTGDLGFLTPENQLFVCGRLKDMIIINGRNVYPNDIESVLEDTPGLRRGCIAAFGIEDQGVEKIVVVAEVKTKDNFSEIYSQMRRNVASMYGVEIHEILLIKEKTIPKTTSGKIRRFECKQNYKNNEYKIVDRSKLEKKQAPVQQKTISRDLSQVEQMIVDGMRRVLGDVEIDVTRPFMEQGLDSIKSMQLIGELSRILNRELSATLFFQFPTISSLAVYLSEQTIEKIEQKHIRDTEIAIIGASCRLAGDLSDPDLLFDFLSQGKRVTPTNHVVRLSDSDLYSFDPTFFHMSPREAQSTDPQQRIILTLAYEALEDAGIRASEISGTDSAVFVGCSSRDFLLGDQATTHTATGSGISMLANRVSYNFDLRGKSAVIDTACSSSLVAVDDAVQYLTTVNTSKIAIVGGINVCRLNEVTSALKNAGFLGDCKVFDANADGYVRGEGSVVLILKRKEEAIRDGDRIYSIIRGSSVTQDGRSNGLTAPNPTSQRSAILSAQKMIKPMYIEAHGTGTKLGDPIEIDVIRGLCPQTWVGSVKSNLGHLEGAAGILGLLKASLMLYHQKMVPTVNLTSLNPLIQWGEVKPVRQVQVWNDAQRYAGVSSFGYGGTNAHVALASHDTAQRSAPTTDAEYVLTFSAVTQTSLENQLAKFNTYLQSNPDLRDVAHTLRRRNNFEWRKAVVARQGVPIELSGGSKSKGNKPVFLFPGQGASDAVTACQNITDETFVSTFTRVQELFKKYTDTDLRAALETENDLVVTQMVLFTCQIALSEMMKKIVGEPRGVIGHSLGEIGAAVVSGAISLEDAVRVVCYRAACLKQLEGKGKMLIARMSYEEAQPYVQEKISIAAVNGEKSVTLSGDTAAMDSLSETLTKNGISHKFLSVSTAFHSHQIDTIREEFLSKIGQVPTRKSSVKMYSTTDPTDTMEKNALYWYENMRQTVWFHKAITRMEPKSVCVEMASRELLSPQVRRLQFGSVCAWTRSFAETTAELYNIGLNVHFEPIEHAQVIALPKYSFDNKIFRVEKWENNYLSFGNDLERLCMAYVKNALDKIASNNDTVTKHQTLLYEHLKSFKLVTADADALLESMQEKYHDFSAEIKMAKRCGESLYNVLIGKSLPHEILFPDGDTTDAEQLYERSSLSTIYNQQIKTFMKELVSKNNKLRFLEIGAGTGGLTSHVLDAIGNNYAEYIYTDVSKLFLTRAQSKFSDKHLKYAILDIEQVSSMDQFDVILAANVMHATHLSKSLPNVHSLLAPNGIAIFLEVTRPSLFLDISFGLTDGWWRRGVHPLMNFNQWKDLLSNHDLEATRLPDDIEFQSVIIARNAKQVQIKQGSTLNFVSQRERTKIDFEQAKRLFKMVSESKIDLNTLLPQIREFALSIIASTLDMSPNEIEHDESLSTYGMDSLLGLELRNIIWREVGVKMKLTDLIGEKGVVSVNKLCSILVQSAQETEEKVIEDDNHDNIYMNMNGTREHQMNGNGHVNAHTDGIDIVLEMDTYAEPAILAMGTALPQYSMSQQEMADLAIKYYELDDTMAQKLRKVYDGSNIERRHSVVDLPNMNTSVFESFQARNEIYEVESTELAVRSCKQALQRWGGNLQDITHIVSVSTTGNKIPGIEFELVNRLGLKKNVQRVAINFMGCFGALPGLKTAHSFAKQAQKNRVLLVCTEICSTHIERESTMENFVSSAIFADGSGAAVIGCAPFAPFERPSYHLCNFASYAVDDSMDKMYWKVTDRGWRLGLSKEIPDLIFDNLEKFTSDLLPNFGTKDKISKLKCDWALHPGGKAILVAIESALGLKREQTQHSWEIMRECGNMSSATIMFVLERMCQNLDAKSEYNCCMVFGPGLTIEGAVLRKAI
jgi:acyl transferase domain-containing protein/predicted naringenin-chalcone synthase/acyl carrier protein